MEYIDDKSVELIVTSPPYPMIEMWDELFLKGECKKYFEQEDFKKAYYLMHLQLLDVWRECYRVLCDGGIACINIGDACRSLDKNFSYFPNHATITEMFLGLGFQCLPPIMWRKPSNKPNKFMGSGMLPPSAYVTLEQEYILIFRKGSRRKFKNSELRRKSAYFWEERNLWFCDSWKILGTKQKIDIDKKVRDRNAAYPLEIPLRLISMFSVRGDSVLDPFVGTGTTSVAAMLTGRESVGYEIHGEFANIFYDRIENIKQMSLDFTEDRFLKHKEFVANRIAEGKKVKHYNENHDFKVMTSQEKDIELLVIDEIDPDHSVTYKKYS
jgi:DNA modification methylase